MNLSVEQLNKLGELEQAVYDAGIDGGEATSAAIEALKDYEKECGLRCEND